MQTNYNKLNPTSYSGVGHSQEDLTKPGTRPSDINAIYDEEVDMNQPAAQTRPEIGKHENAYRDMSDLSRPHGDILHALHSSKSINHNSFANLKIPLLSMVLLFVAFFLPVIMFSAFSEFKFFPNPDMEVQLYAIVVVTTCAPLLLFIAWALYNISKQFSSKELNGDKHHKKRSSWTVIYFGIVIAIHYLSKSVNALIGDDRKYIQEAFNIFRNDMRDFFLYIAVLSLISDFEYYLGCHLKKLDAIGTECPKGAKWKGIMRYNSTWNDTDLDYAYAVPAGECSPAALLLGLSSFTFNMIRLVGTIYLVLGTTEYELQHFLWVASVIMGILVYTFKDAVISLVFFALGNTFHIGELISISRPGFTPGNNPANSVMGFVEAISFGHIVLRDFTGKQVFIPHSQIKDLVVSNWARRPFRQLLFTFSVVPGQSGGAKNTVMLCRFMREWIDSHVIIDQGYKKCVCSMGSDGNHKITVIFRTKTGSGGGIQNAIKAEFLLMVTEAAKRLNICLLPAILKVDPSNVWDTDHDKSDINEESMNNGEMKSEGVDDVNFIGSENTEREKNVVDLNDLLPSKDLSKLSGYDYDWVEKQRKKFI